MVVDVDSAWPTIVGTVDYETKFRLNRTTGKKLHLARNVCLLLSEHFQNVC